MRIFPPPLGFAREAEYASPLRKSNGICRNIPKTVSGQTSMLVRAWEEEGIIREQAMEHAASQLRTHS
jgi:hypothetical protein